MFKTSKLSCLFKVSIFVAPFYDKLDTFDNVLCHVSYLYPVHVTIHSCELQLSLVTGSVVAFIFNLAHLCDACTWLQCWLLLVAVFLRCLNSYLND